MSSLPFQVLPKTLHMKTNRFINPPVFHYGYTFKREWLYGYAREHSLLDLHRDSNDTEIISLQGTIENVFEYIVKEVQLLSFNLEFYLIRALPGMSDHCCLMTICSNYRRDDEDRRPEIEDVKKLQRFLGFSEPPGWYVDYEDWGWECRDLRTFTV